MFVRVWFETDGNAAPRWERGYLRPGLNPGGFTLELSRRVGGADAVGDQGNKIFPLAERTVQVYGGPELEDWLFSMDEHGLITSPDWCGEVSFLKLDEGELDVLVGSVSHGQLSLMHGLTHEFTPREPGLKDAYGRLFIPSWGNAYAARRALNGHLRRMLTCATVARTHRRDAALSILDWHKEQLRG